MAGDDTAEEARILDLLRPIRDFVGSGKPLVVFRTDDLRRFALVDSLRSLPETFARVAVDVNVPEQGERPSVSERRGSLGIGHGGVEPVEGGRRDCQIKGSFLQRGLLEGSGTHFCLRIPFQVAAGDRGHIFADLDAQDAVAAAGEGHRGLASAAPDLEYPSSRRYSGERDDVVEEISRIAGTNLVVERRRLIEGRPEPASYPSHKPALTDVPQRAETDEQHSGVLRERDDGVGEPSLLDC